MNKIERDIQFLIALVSLIITIICALLTLSIDNKIICEDDNDLIYNDITQENIEDTINEVVRELFLDADNNLSEYKKYIEDEEYNEICSNTLYKDGCVGINEINIYSCRRYYNTNNIEKEIVDLKVDYDNYNRMFIIEFILSDKGKIKGHRIRAY